MKISEHKLIEWFLRISLSGGMLSAVADRLGLWSKELSVWGNWENFSAYTNQLSPWLPFSMVGLIAGIVTLLEIIFAVTLLTTFKTPLIAKCTGFLLLLFGISMATFVNIKAPLDYSVFVGAAGAFALSLLVREKRSALR